MWLLGYTASLTAIKNRAGLTDKKVKKVLKNVYQSGSQLEEWSKDFKDFKETVKEEGVSHDRN